MIEKKEIEQIYFIEKELEMWQEELECLREDGGLKSPLLDGLPKGKNWIGDPVGKRASKNADNRSRERRIEEAKEKVNELIDKLEKSKLSVLEYISELDDPQMRMIIKLRCINRMNWEMVARRIGGGNTASNVRLKFWRHFETNETQK